MLKIIMVTETHHENVEDRKRAAERQAAAQSVEEAELARATENASTLRSTENVAKKDSGESGENPEGNTCALCERTFENVKV